MLFNGNSVPCAPMNPTGTGDSGQTAFFAGFGRHSIYHARVAGRNFFSKQPTARKSRAPLHDDIAHYLFWPAALRILSAPLPFCQIPDRAAAPD